jgi:uncharacterized membrane protein
MSFVNKLRDETSLWVNDGLIDTAQREVILARYGRDESAGRLATVMGLIGGAIAVTGIALIISANWQAIGDWTKIGGLIALLVASYTGAWRLKFGPVPYPKTGDTLLMAGGALFLCGIALVSQIYHLNDRPANAALIWWVAIAAVPWLARSKPALLLSVLAGLIWIGMEVTTEGSPLALYRNEHWWRDENGMIALYVLLGLGLFSAGLAMRRSRWKELAGAVELPGLLTLHGALFFLSFARHDWPEQAARWVAPAVVLLLAATATAMAWRGRTPATSWLIGLCAAAILPALGVLAAYDGADGYLASGAAWVLLLGIDLALARAGVLAGRPGWVNLGLAFIGLNIFARYWDLFGSMLQGGAFFLVTGLALIGLGYGLERQRRRLQMRMKEMKP